MESRTFSRRKLVKLGAPALLAVGACLAGGVAVASAKIQAADMKAAAELAAKASKAAARRDAAAVSLAEQAVALAPQDASYRALLGQAYLQAGRFESARAALAEALQLYPEDGRVALNLSLAQIATGDWAAARKTLEAHADRIPASDTGLALALAGDPASAVALLTQAARQPGANAKTRQNLALALALAGQWQVARVVAEADMSPDKVDARMLEWAALAQPRAASDQVAHLLGVQAVTDPGRPSTIALNAPVAAAPVAFAEAAPVAQPPVLATLPAKSGMVFAERREVVQALPVTTIQPNPGAAKVALSAKPQLASYAPSVAAKPRPVARLAPPPARGEWFVQLGAYDSPAVARDAWGRATRRYATLQGRTPTGMNFSTGKGAFYRLSVGGFARADAVRVCREYRARGGACFVRAGAGDQVAAWARPARVQLAMR